MTKLLIIGFDGMDYFLAKKTINKFSFNNFRPFLKRQTVLETITGPSWASFYTGLKKEIHNVKDSWARDVKDSNTFASIENCVFWRIIEKANHTVYLENLPITPQGFPFASKKNRDIVNWVYRPVEGGTGKWRRVIKKMDFEKLLSKVKKDSFSLFKDKKLGKNDLVFLQFSFLDRIGHVFTFKDKEKITKSYNLAYLLMDELYGSIKPEHLIITSDHGFWKNLGEHRGANDAVLILNEKSYRFFLKNKVFRKFSIEYKLTARQILRRVYRALTNLNILEFFQFFFQIDYIEQTDIFEQILKIFGIDYKKTQKRIPKKQGRRKRHKSEEEIKERLKRLGYI